MNRQDQRDPDMEFGRIWGNREESQKWRASITMPAEFRVADGHRGGSAENYYYYY
jgi:hypothetical protein